MKKYLLFGLFNVCFFIVLKAQSKVANFSTGSYGTKNYEHFSFWIKDGKRTIISYSYGVKGKDIKLKYLGADMYKGDSCFKVQFPNNYILFIIPKNLVLQVAEENGTYLKNFSWEYEGPINGIGTFCEICAEDGDAAMRMINLYYLK